MNNKEREILSYTILRLKEMNDYSVDDKIEFLLKELGDIKLNMMIDEYQEYDDYKNELFSKIEQIGLEMWQIENPLEHKNSYIFSRTYRKGNYFKRAKEEYLEKLKKEDTDESLYDYDFIKRNF